MVTTPGDAIARREPFEFGELTVTFDADGAVVRGPATGAPSTSVDASPAALRDWVRFDDAGMYRPFPGARTLRHDWHVHCATREQLVEALDTIYPLALRHTGQWHAGTLRLVSLDDVLARQSGRADRAAALSDQGRTVASHLLCGGCVRTPMWRGDTLPAAGIACPEPCSILVSLCREAVAWEEKPPPPATVDRTVHFAQFETPGNVLREAFLEARRSGRTGQVR